MYEERPRACREFACRLYDRHRREGGPIEPRLAAIARVRELVADLQAQGLKPADLDRASGDPSRAHAMRLYAELQQRLEDDFGRA